MLSGTAAVTQWAVVTLKLKHETCGCKINLFSQSGKKLGLAFKSVCIYLQAIGFTASVTAEDGAHMEGYLFKKTKHAFKAWVR